MHRRCTPESWSESCEPATRRRRRRPATGLRRRRCTLGRGLHNSAPSRSLAPRGPPQRRWPPRSNGALDGLGRCRRGPMLVRASTRPILDFGALRLLRRSRSRSNSTPLLRRAKDRPQERFVRPIDESNSCCHVGVLMRTAEAVSARADSVPCANRSPVKATTPAFPTSGVGHRRRLIPTALC